MRIGHLSVFGRYESPQQLLVFFISQAVNGFERGDPFVAQDLVIRLELALARRLHVPVENHLRLALHSISGVAREASDHGVVAGLFLDLALRGDVPALALFNVAFGQSPVLVFRPQNQQNLGPARSLAPDDAARRVSDFPVIHRSPSKFIGSYQYSSSPQKTGPSTQAFL